MKKCKRITLFLSLLFLSLNAWGITLPANSEPGFSLSNGSFTHQGTAIKGSTSSVLSPDFTFNYYLKPTQAILSGLDLHLNFAQGQMGLFGLRVGYKWYYWGQGHNQLSESAFMSTKMHQRFSAFAGSVFKRYTYFLSNSFEAGGNFESSGSFYNIDALTGADYMLNHRLKATSSISFTLMSLAATDSRIKMASMIISFGVAYLY